MIAGVLTEDWSIDRLESILRAVLRCGTYELAHRSDIPPKVVISEYLAVADAFLGEPETRLANGVLDQLAHALRPGEMGESRGGPPASR
jgi:N utilization substance protein B